MGEANRRLLSPSEDGNVQTEVPATPRAWWPPADRTQDDTTAPLTLHLADASYHSARKSVIAQFESRYVRWLVRKTRGNISEAARVAGIERATVYRLLQRLGRDRDLEPG
jgi:transcriptional regulator of acetoin/glycerol metabolism